MKRKTGKLIIAKQFYELQSLFPFDFLTEKFWPFAYYRLPENIETKNNQLRINWNLKPQKDLDFESDMAAAIKHALEIGANLKFDEYSKIEKDEKTKTILLSAIYSLTYDLTTAQKYLCPFENIRRDQAEMIYFKSKFYNCEPYALLGDIQTESPELYNPKRYDFNIFILGCGWDRERREIETAQREAKAKMPMVRTR
jgi:hypothetical protein